MSILRSSDVAIFSDGVADSSEQELISILAHSPHRQDIRWPDCHITQLYATLLSGNKIGVIAKKFENCPTKPLKLKALTLQKNGHFTPIQKWDITPNLYRTFSIESALLPSLHALTIEGTMSPAGLALLKAPSSTRSVGILRQSGDDKPLIGNVFYLKRALENFTLSKDITPSSLKQSQLSVILATDGSLSSDTASEKVLNWVQNGGILIRFAGPILGKSTAQILSPTQKALITVPLRQGERTLGGSMSWSTPQNLAPFPPNSPLYGLTVAKDVSVKKQLIAEPSETLSSHVWATLNDGTPLITARQEGKGWVILFHVTPTADWSNLPLSGLFPQILEKLIEVTPHVNGLNETGSIIAETSLSPWKTLSLKGTLEKPPLTALPLPRNNSDGVSATHPVGFYGVAPNIVPFNLVQNKNPLIKEPLLGVFTKPDLSPAHYALGPFLLVFALILLMLDLILTICRHGNFSKITLRISIICLTLPILHSPSGYAASLTAPPEALQPSLAFIPSGQADTDEIVKEGLKGLTHFINQRSTAHLSTPRAVTPGQDNLAFYPVIYWPITTETKLSNDQAKALNEYMSHDGLLLIDEMGAGSLIGEKSLKTIQTILRNATKGLSIPPLELLTDKQTLARTFYILHDFPGRIAGQDAYIAHTQLDEGEDVSPIIIGNADWVHAWAIDDNNHTLFAVIPEGEDQRTLAYRFGMNVVMYALTGNYKYDQRTYPEMLKRLKTNGPSSIEEEGDE
ncbi:DUF4159 domain-containing protein [Aristophania vespae]|uniref:DUF4159 domain-containing protein n=1 Tax=Aristophania vespae TaxID=2697033 RepID=A0A6P1NEN9_9PROT|nr:DUF4159 domain-containing protein [Aristophania vespae]QHI95873.1 DUF4159 domain-containing protein [Aristophania vespae]